MQSSFEMEVVGKSIFSPLVFVLGQHLLLSCFHSFEVLSADSSSSSAETIKIDRIAPAVAAVGVSFGLYAFPTLRPQATSAARSRSRPRSGLLSAALDVFGGGSGLRRGNSMTSRGSSNATTSIMTPNLSASMSPRATSPFANLSPRPSSTPAVPEPSKRPISKHSAPDLFRRASNNAEDLLDSSILNASTLENKSHGPDPEETNSETIDRNLRNNRSLSLPPPPHARLGSLTPSPERDTTPRAHSPLGQNVDTTFDGDTSVDLDSTMDASFEPIWPTALEVEAPATSPMAYRPAALGSTRRRMIGPREMRSASSLGNANRGFESPQPHPFANQESPSPQRRAFTAHPTIPSSQIDQPAPPSPVESTREDSPSQSLSGSIASNSKRTRPEVEASPRPTPRKKVAALGEIFAGPRAPSALSQPLFPANRVSSGSKDKPRIPSGSHIKIRSRRVTSNTSTIRGPPTPPKKESIPDVFSDPAEEVPEEEDVKPDIAMLEVSNTLSSLAAQSRLTLIVYLGRDFSLWSTSHSRQRATTQACSRSREQGEQSDRVPVEPVKVTSHSQRLCEFLRLN